MKPKILLPVIILFLASQAYCQNYIEIFEDGWGQGVSHGRPVFVDLADDGLLDMIIGSYFGSFHHYEQESQGTFTFNYVSANFNDINVGSQSTPYFVDLDNNGRLDMIVGSRDGWLSRFEQDAAGSLDFSLVSDNFNNINVGEWSVPTFCDLDNNGLLDLIVGIEEGTLKHYQQNAPEDISFSLVSDSLGGVVSGRNYAASFMDLDNDGLLDMILGDVWGVLKHYEQDAANSTSFNFLADKFNSIDVGWSSQPFPVDLDNDGLQEIIIGSSWGPIWHYEQEATSSVNLNLLSNNFLDIIDVGVHSAPAFADIDGDGLLDMLIGEWDGVLNHYEQASIGSGSFPLVTEKFDGIDVGQWSVPYFTDLDNDGLIDLIVGTREGHISHFEQNAANAYDFTLIADTLSGINVGYNAAPACIDLDNDGLLDLLVGEEDGNINHLEQDALNSFTFTSMTDSFLTIDMGKFSTPCFTDLDGDSLLDMIVGNQGGHLRHFEQDEKGSLNFTKISDDLAGISLKDRSMPVFADINNDGRHDLLVGERDGSIYYYQRTTDTGFDDKNLIKSGKLSYRLFPNYPNPFNAETVISYQISAASNVEINIYNLLGQKITTLVSKMQQAGSYKVKWDAGAMASGVYLYKIQTDQGFVQTRKLILLK